MRVPPLIAEQFDAYLRRFLANPDHKDLLMYDARTFLEAVSRSPALHKVIELTVLDEDPKSATFAIFYTGFQIGREFEANREKESIK